MYFEVLTIPIREFMFFVDHCFFDTLYERVSILNISPKITLYGWLNLVSCVLYIVKVYFIYR